MRLIRLRLFILSLPAPLLLAAGLTATLATLATPAWAQDTGSVRIAPVTVTVTRDPSRPALELPYGVTRIDVDSTRAGTRRASLTEMLLLVPGVSVSNRFNPTQDPRIAVRGFGARSAFGIRGIRVMRDGIPLTLADGQTAVDAVDLETIGATEIFRGSAGALYGNSSGGVLDLRTEAPPETGSVGSLESFRAGSIDRLSLRGASRVGGAAVQAFVTRNAGDGPRDYSHFRSTNALGDVRWNAAGTRFEAQASIYDAPFAENPGAVTDSVLEADPTAANPAYITKKAGKVVRQSLFSLQGSHESERGTLTASLFGGGRSLLNPLTYTIVDLNRHTFGASVLGETRPGTSGSPWRFSAGADLLNQLDERANYSNCAGVSGANRDPATCPTADDRGVVTLKQREHVTGVGAFARAELDATDRLSVTGTVRGDRTRFSVLGRLPNASTSGTDGTRTLGAVTPMAGVNWRIGPLASVYVNVASSFETPTTTELSNQPDGSGGLNRELKPQHALTLEAGARGIWRGRVHYDAALFHVGTRDELIQFEVPNGGGRTYYRNAGRTSRTGAELALSTDAGIWSLGATASWLRYVYDDYVVSGTSYDGNRVPGVAPATYSAFLTARPTWGLLGAELQHVARLPADDANLNYAAAYTLVNLRATLALHGGFDATPMAGVDNLFDRHYASNVVANASFGRFYEPGAPRTFWIGLRLGTSR